MNLIYLIKNKLDEIIFFYKFFLYNMNEITTAIFLSLLIVAVYGITIYYQRKYISKCKIVYKLKK